MKKLKKGLIHLLGGRTDEDVIEDIILSTRPHNVGVSRFRTETVKVCQCLRPDMMELYSDYMNITKKDMVYRLADKMLEENLVNFSSEKEDTDRILVTAYAKVVIPEEVGEWR